jgi:ribonuclease-3
LSEGHALSASQEALQQRLGHRFRQPALLQRALTHRSASSLHNERLEFLGDAVLELAISALLYERFAESDEGDLTRIRAHLVREETLHRAALQLGLPAVIRLSEAEMRGGGSQRASILADAMEAVIGAVMLDAGFAAAQAVVGRLLGDRVEGTEVAQWRKDAKTALQEWLQGRKLPLPSYRIVATRGRDHEQVFEVACEVSTEAGGPPRVTQAEGLSRRSGEQNAARLMLQQLQAAPRRGQADRRSEPQPERLANRPPNPPARPTAAVPPETP